jgi:hypothetical protein
VVGANQREVFAVDAVLAGKIMSSKIKMAPMVIAESATLNAG